VIAIRGLRFAYPGGAFRLEIPSFEMQAGEKLAVIGPSGSGKTTLLNLVSGILTPSSGAVRVADTDIAALSDAGRRAFRIRQIGFVFQDFELLDYLNVLDNILHPYRISALRLDRTVRERAEGLAGRLGVGDKLKRRANDLSQGEKQRVAICRALLPGPRLILADEATGNLDPRNKGRILDLLFDSVEDHGATLLAVTHDHDLLPRFDRVVDFGQFLPETRGIAADGVRPSPHLFPHRGEGA
jgi:putative ABC transport system ATP-binding protein